MPASTADPRRALEDSTERLALLIRLSLTPVLVAYGLATATTSLSFWIVLVLGLSWQGAGLRFRDRGWWRARVEPLAPLGDYATIAGVLLTTGGGDSPLADVLILLPVLSGLIRRPQRTARTGLLVALILLTAAVPDLVAGRAVLDDVLAALIGTAFGTLVGLGFARGLTALADHAASVDQARRRLLGASLDAEDRERRRVSRELGGEALQLLLAARQDLHEVHDLEDRQALASVREQIRSGVAVLRQTVRDLHPTSLRHAGLGPALLAAMEHRIEGEVTAGVDPDAIGVREAMLLGLVRELGDALRAADRDESVAAHVSRDDACVQLEVRARSSAPRREESWEPRLAQIVERVEADGGTLALAAGHASETILVVRLPVDGRAVPRGSAGRTETPEVARLSARMLSAGRLAAVPTGALMVLLGGRWSWAFTAVGAVMVVWQVLSARALRAEDGGPARDPRSAVVDLALLAALVAATGGALSPLLGLVLVVPFLLIFRVPPGTAAALSGVLAAFMLAATAPQVLRGEAGALEAFAPWVAALAWATITAWVLGQARQRLRRRVAGLEQARRRVLHDSLDVADAERRRLSEALHDNALQVLMIAGQDLDEALDGDEAAFELARGELDDGISLVRDTMAELHPPALEHGGLRPAVVALLESARVRGGFNPVVAVAPEAAGLRDELVLALVRELVGNAAKHARAKEVRVRVARHEDELLLEVADDGVGIAPGRPAEAIAGGHIGLVSARERVEVDGGRLEIETAPGRGTRVRIRLVAVSAAVVL